MEQLPDGAPNMDLVDARRLATELFELTPTSIKDLGSYQDRNFLVRTEEASFVLKVAGATTPVQALVAQNEAMTQAGGLPFAVPTPVVNRAGETQTVVELAGTSHVVRLLTFVEGTPMTEFGYLSPRGAFELGRLSGSMARELREFDHPGAHRFIQWDIRVFETVVERMIGALRPADQDAVAQLRDRASEALAKVSALLPVQVIHGDVTDFNVVAQHGADHRPMPTGIIDFGDLVYSWRAAEAAVTISSQLVKNPDSPLSVAADVLAGFVSVQPLTEVEVEGLWPMIAARACVGLVSTAYQLTSEPDNVYLHQNLAVDEAVFETVFAIPFELAHAKLAQAAGITVSPIEELVTRMVDAPGASVVPAFDSAEMASLDLGVMSDVLSGGVWLDAPALRARIERISLSQPEGLIVDYRQAHLHRSEADSAQEPSTIHLGADVVVPVGTAICAPRAGLVTSVAEGRLRIETEFGLDILFDGLTSSLTVGQQVPLGGEVGRVAAGSSDPAMPTHLHLGLVRSGVAEVPTHVPGSLADAWSWLCPDPAFLLGRSVGPQPERAGQLQARRESVLAGVQKHYYQRPPRIERGWRQYLCDTDARVYLDGVNNVTVLGHSHPAVEAAVSYQLRTLNTNSRFHYSANVDFAQMLSATLPESLNRVFLLSTGSEAVDLALRLARTYTDAKDTISLRTAYHGWTIGSDEVSSALMDNPRALETRPPWIHLAEPPNLYRGPFRGADAATRYADDVRRILAQISSEGRPVAGFICETLNGNAGGIMLPDGYLAQVYADVRAAGGVVIADEVQVGYGRLGEYFWGFQMHGVTPDIVCLAKATGNGYPVSAVVCTEEIAEAFAQEGSLFASTGGSPAGAAAAIATLSAIQDEDLQGNALRIGGRLRSGLERLVETYEMAGAVHGMGLYLGLEIVVDKESQTPATEATEALCDRLLALGIVMQPTGDYLNVLKIKPPLCIDAASVDFLLAALDSAFRNGW